MRNMLFAYAALGLLAVASTVNAQSPEGNVPVPDGAIEHAAQAVVHGVQADAAPVIHGEAAPIVHSEVAPTIQDHGAAVLHNHGTMPADAQPMNQYQAVQGVPAMTAQPYAVHQHQPAHHHHHHHAHTVQKKQSVFSKLLELERKKNAWLKKTFLKR